MKLSKKLLFSAVCALLMCATTIAQKGNNSIGIRAEAGFPVGDFSYLYKTGFGGSAICLFGVGNFGQISLRSGYVKFKFEGNSEISLIPIMAGYRHSFSIFYLHPEAGVRMLGKKVPGGESEHNTRFGWAIGGGIARGGFDGGVRYEKIIPYIADYQFSQLSIIGVHIGYNFRLGRMSK